MSNKHIPTPPIPPGVQALAARIPLFAGAPDLRIAPLEGVISLNNTSYRVEAGGSRYLLRIGAETARLLGIRREEEIEAATAAAKAGVAPKVLYADPDGVMVMAFIQGRHWDQEDFHQPANIQRLAATLRRLHAVKYVTASGSESMSVRAGQPKLAGEMQEFRTEPGDLLLFHQLMGHIGSNNFSDAATRHGTAALYREKEKPDETEIARSCSVCATVPVRGTKWCGNAPGGSPETR